MELSKNILDGIAIAGNDKVFSDSAFLILLKDVFEVAAGKISSQESELKCVECDQKIAFTSLLSVILEAAKVDLDSATFSSFLEDYQLGPQRTTSFVNMYQENKEKIQLPLSLIGKNYDQIIDIDWRQDYIIKSSHCEKICEPSYVISLKTWNSQSNSENDVTFGCTLEQLQDLVLKLKDATKCIERNAS